MEHLDSENYKKEFEFDFVILLKLLWIRKRLFYKVISIAFIISLIIVLGIPNNYTATVVLAPESSKRSNASLMSAASMLGLGNLVNSSESDALNMTLFPDILNSTPFALELYKMPVRSSEKGMEMPLNEYIASEKKTLWKTILYLPFEALNSVYSIFSHKEEILLKYEIDPFRLTQKETTILNTIKSKIATNINKKNGITTITVSMQDPEIAAVVADSVVSKLQEYITNYRTKKAAADCEYWEKLYKEKQMEYYTAQQKYATYLDGNKSLFTQKSKIEGERLQNEMNLAYQIYNQMATQLQIAQGKLQEAKPVFAIVEPATIPLRPSEPRRMVIVVGCLFFAFVGTAGWILFRDNGSKILKQHQ